MRVLYVTSGIAPHRLGGMQAVARMHVELLAERNVDMAIVHSTGVITKPKGDLPGREYALEWPASRGPARKIPGHYVMELRRYSRQVAEIVQKESPAVVYAEGPLVSSLLRGIVGSPPVVFHPHGLEMFQDLGSSVQNLRSRPLRRITRLHARRAAKVISQGGRLTRILVDRCGADPKSVCTLPNALSSEFLREEPQQLSVPTRFLFIGRSEPRKGLSLLLQAMKELPNATLDVIGPHHKSGDRPSQISWHGEVRDRVLFKEILSKCHYLVLPSLAEGMPTVVLEAMARGLPVIASDVGAVPEVVRPGNNGWLTQPGSVAQLVESLMIADRVDPDHYVTLSHGAIETIRSRFLREHVGNRLLEILRGAAGEMNSVSSTS